MGNGFQVWKALSLGLLPLSCFWLLLEPTVLFGRACSMWEKYRRGVQLGFAALLAFNMEALWTACAMLHVVRCDRGSLRSPGVVAVNMYVCRGCSVPVVAAQTWLQAKHYFVCVCGMPSTIWQAATPLCYSIIEDAPTCSAGMEFAGCPHTVGKAGACLVGLLVANLRHPRLSRLWTE